MTQPVDSGGTSPIAAEQVAMVTEQQDDMNDRQNAADVPNEVGGQGSLADRLACVSISVQEDVPEGASGVTAFFLFSNVHRQRVKESLSSNLRGSEKLAIGHIGKKIGEMWGKCSDETKKKYADRAKQNKEHVKRSHDDGAGKDPGGVTEAPLKLPRSVVKRIVMLDQEQSRITGDALELLSSTAELFLETVAKRAYNEAIGAARSTLAFRDVDSVLRRMKPTAWAASPFLELEPDSKPDSQAPSKALKEAASKTKAITSFFRPAA